MLAMVLAVHLLTARPEAAFCHGETTFACLVESDGCHTGEFCDNALVRTWCLHGICGD